LEIDLDNPATEPSTDVLDTNAAGNLFASMLDPVEPDKEAPVDEPAEAEVETEEATEDDPVVTIKIDGKDVEVKLSELKNGYQRQADYTRKTMEVSEQRKAAEAETMKARQEREAYATNLNRLQAQLEATLQEQQQVDWEALLNSDPVEYLKQQHLAQARQAKLQQVYAAQHHVASQQKAEAEQSHAAHLQAQHQALLDKLPDWKDAKKADAERAAIRDFLVNEGFDRDALNNITDAKAVVLARKAMLYDQMMSKAHAAAKKVSTLPTKVERPGVASEAPGLDKRTSAYQKLAKSGKPEDAAALFASMF
jgi:hypothetical protein